MFCGKCGKQYPDINTFCPYCGHPNSKAAVPASQAPLFPAKPAKKKPLGLILTLAAIVVILGILAAVFLPKLLNRGSSGDSYTNATTDPITHYFNFTNTYDYAELEQCCAPGYLEYILFNNGSDVASFRQAMHVRQEAAERVGITERRFEVSSSEPITGSDLDALRKELKRSSYGFYDPEKITEARLCELVVTPLKGSPGYLTVFCYEGTWYIHPEILSPYLF